MRVKGNGRETKARKRLIAALLCAACLAAGLIAPAGRPLRAEASNGDANAGLTTVPYNAFDPNASPPSAAAAAANGDASDAEAQPLTAGKICERLGVLLGEDEGGVSDAYLSRKMTRLQAIVITLRLMGYEEAAREYVGRANFTDAYAYPDATMRAMLAYAKAYPKLGWEGDEFGRISPEGAVTAQAMAKVLLTVLGYTVDKDYKWEDAVAFGRGMGLAAQQPSYGGISNKDMAEMLVQALKIRIKGSEHTLGESLVNLGVINRGAAYETAMLPGSRGFRATATYLAGGPLLLEALADAPAKTLTLRFNTSLNPTYAKAIKNYSYYFPGGDYIPLPSRCKTSMQDGATVQIRFPDSGWVAYESGVEKDAFLVYIMTSREDELKVSGLRDVDGAWLPDITIDIRE